MANRPNIVLTYQFNENGELDRLKWSGITSKKTWTGDIDALVLYLERLQTGSNIWVHGLHIVGGRIVRALEKKGYTYTEDKVTSPKQYGLFAINSRQWYSLTFCNEKGTRHTLKDIFHICPVDIPTMRKSFSTPEAGELQTLKDTLLYLRAHGLTHYVTIGSAVMSEIKKSVPNFDLVFPTLDKDEDAFCRAAYLPGIMYYNQNKKQVRDVQGTEYDVNSMYPFILSRCPLPCGHPKHFDDLDELKEGQPFIGRFRLSAKLKDGAFPCLYYKDRLVTELLERANDDIVTITSAEFYHLQEFYDVDGLEFMGGYKFRACRGAFDDVVMKYYDIKKNAKSEGERVIAKLMLNNIVGKFGTRPDGSRLVYDKGNFAVMSTERQTVYVPLAAFVNAYARLYIAHTAADIGKENVLYIDTDSVFTDTDKKPENVSDALGDFKKAQDFDAFAVNAIKQYAVHSGNTWTLTVAGLPRGTLGGIKDITAEGYDFIKKFTLGFEVEAVAYIQSEGIYKQCKTKFKIGA